MSERAAETPADLLVAILPDQDSPPAALFDVAAAWAQAFPLSVLVIFEELENIEAHLTEVLAQVGLPPRRLLLVGLGEGGRIGLPLALEAAPRCAGVLVYDALPDLPVSADLRSRGVKIRLIGRKAEDPRHDDRLGDVVRRLAGLGIDTRATQLLEPGLTPSAIRLGAAYLAELSASALDLPLSSPGPGTAGAGPSNEVDDAC
jgi:pimeloyl-ACP methyl ester carboxylesterase